jgi:beta-glucosidase
MNWADQNLPAIVQGFYPGETTGIALTRLLFGDFNPSGRLPVTFYKSEKDIPDFSNYDMQGRTYRYFKGTPLYPFGFGLSYTTYEYSNLKVDESASTSSSIKVTVDVKNAGKMDGEEVAQLYVSNKSGKSDQPLVALKSFQRVCLNKGEQKTVTFELKNEEFSLTNSDAQQVVEPGIFEIAVGGSAQDKRLVVRTIKLTGNTVVIN